MILKEQDIIDIAEKNRLSWLFKCEVDRTNIVNFTIALFEAEKELRHSYEKCKEEEFYVMAQGVVDYSLPVIRMGHDVYGDMLTIMATEEAIYVTKEQAMEFWNLKDCV